jgi:hypothetical protein
VHIPEIDVNLDFIKVNTNTSFISLMVRQGMIKRAMVKMTTVKGEGTPSVWVVKVYWKKVLLVSLGISRLGKY